MIDNQGYNTRQGRRRLFFRLLAGAGAVSLLLVAALRVARPILKERRERAELHSTAVALFGAGPAADDYAARMLPILRDPRLPARLAAADRGPSTTLAVSLGRPGADAVARIGYAGMARLSAGELETSLDLRRELAERSSVLCAGLWTGGLDGARLAAGLRGLSEDRKQAWVDLAIHATTLELHATTAPPPLERKTLAQAWSALRARIPAADRPTFERAVKAGAAATPEDACFAFKTLARLAGELPPPQRDAIVRSITCPFLIPPS